jgi:hypothetical protein
MRLANILLSLLTTVSIGLLGQTIDWQERSSDHTLPEGVRLFKGTRTSPILEAWYLDVDLSQPDIMIRPYLAGSGNQVPDLTEAFGAYAAINGGFFGGSVSYSAVIYPNDVRAQNIAALTRNGQSYPVIRSLFSVDADRQPSVDWIYHYGNMIEGVYGFDAPMDYSLNQSTPLPAPLSSNGEPLEGLLVGLGGGPTLVKNGQVNVTYDEEIFWGSGMGLDNGDPRTAVGFTANHHVIMMVVDGRQGISQGLGLTELASTLISLGCVEAMNLDGGGSTGMAIGGAYVNHPSEQRAVPSILAIVHADSVQFPETPSNELIIDTGDMGCVLDGGGWFPTANLGYWGSTPSLLNNIGSGDRTATFGFTLENQVSQADVYGWWVAAPNRAADTPFVITHATGVDTVYRDQTTNHGQWNLLGSYAFNAETAYSVTVSNAATTGSYVVADAIRITSESSLETVSLHDEPFKAGSVKRILSVRAYPNPFNPQLTMSYRLGDLSQVGLKIFNVAGQLTRELVSQEIQQRGEHHLIWDGKDNLGQHAPAGVYFARLEAGKESQTIKLVSLK